MAILIPHPNPIPPMQLFGVGVLSSNCKTMETLCNVIDLKTKQFVQLGALQKDTLLCLSGQDSQCDRMLHTWEELHSGALCIVIFLPLLVVAVSMSIVNWCLMFVRNQAHFCHSFLCVLRVLFL